jgi:von Willebrand factor type A domain
MSESPKFKALIELLQQEALDFAQKVESVLSENACKEGLLNDCQVQNYHECMTTFPNPVCKAGGCKHGCGNVRDYTVSVLRLPLRLQSKIDAEATQTICATRELDSYLKGRRQELPEANSFYYGDEQGVFRIFPARYSEVCLNYDPCLRPWYVAGSSGPKNLIIMMDVSRSMKGENLRLLKEAVGQVVNTTALGDFIAIVPFNNSAWVIGNQGQYLLEATAKNKEYINQTVSELEALGANDYELAFETAFLVLRESSDVEGVAFCNTAILFFTDGLNKPLSEALETKILELVQANIKSLSTDMGFPVKLFTYSISMNDDLEGHKFSRDLACATDGIWSKIVNENEIPNSLASYYKLFALSLGDGKNSNFTAWTEPYRFYTNDTKGVTVSAPVYDKSQEPPLFCGVVGVDVALSTLVEKLQDVTSSEDVIKRLAPSSKAKCPKINLTECQLKDFRRKVIAGNDALCSSNCTNTTTVKTCSSAQSLQLPALLANQDNEGLSFFERACCSQNKEPVGQCVVSDGKDKNIGVIVGASVGGAVALLLLAIGLLLFCRNCSSKDVVVKENDREIPPTAPDAVSDWSSNSDVVVPPEFAKNPVKPAAPL